MTHHSDQRQHDRSGEQYGQQPGETGTGTRTGTGMDHQPQFGGSSQQSETGGQGTDMDRSTDSHQRGTQQHTDQRSAQQQYIGQEGGRSTAEREGGSMRGRHPGGQRMSGRQSEMGGTPQSGTQGTQSTRGRAMRPSQERQSTGAMQPTRGTQGGSQATPAPFFEDHMTDELWIALEDFGELSHVAAWCATRCASGGPELGRCARICQDIAEIAALNELLIARDSMFGPEVADMFLRVADEGLPTLRRFQQRHPHVLETVATIERTMNACESLLRQVDGGSQGPQGSGTGTGESRARGMQGMREQGQYGQGMSGQPRSGSEMTGQRY